MSLFIYSEAAEEAGFNVLRFLNEPTAAVLAYDIGQADPQQEWSVSYIIFNFLYMCLSACSFVSVHCVK